MVIKIKKYTNKCATIKTLGFHVSTLSYGSYLKDCISIFVQNVYYEQIKQVSILFVCRLDVGHAVAQLVEALRSKPVAGSIPDSVTESFHRHNPSSLVTKLSTRNNSCGVCV
jgi:hypothetical protein